MKLCHLNVCGWTHNNSLLREKLLQTANAEIISLNETHLKYGDTINVHNYTWFGHNRERLHINAPKGSGGVGFLVHEKLFKSFNISIWDKTYEGILILHFQNKISLSTFAVATCYLPPENSSRGRDADSFFSHLLTCIYNCDVEDFLVCGDFNARIGTLSDLIDLEDDIPIRNVIDTNINQHGRALIDFLQETKMCTLNGRMNPQHDDFTCSTFRGTSVIDYILVSHDTYEKCSNFRVKQCDDLVNEYNLYHLLGERSKIPDHALLCVDIEYSYICSSQDVLNVMLPTKVPANNRIREKYNCKSLPCEFLDNDIANNRFENIMQSIMCAETNQENVNSVYQDITDLLINEMDRFLPKVKPPPNQKGNSGNKRKKQPFWNEILENLLRNMQCKKREFKMGRGSNRKATLWQNFKVAQGEFDKKFRFYKRKYHRDIMHEIEQLNTSNPKEFWSKIKSIGPKRKSRIPFEILGEDGEIITDTNQILQKWKSDFHSLFTVKPNDLYNENYLAQIS